MKYKRCVPDGRARKELYQMLMEWSAMVAQWFAGLFNLAYRTSHTLGTWELAQSAQLEKHNGKPGTLGIRLIMMLDPMGKAYYRRLHTRTQDTKTHFGYGFYTNRRREQAILVHHAVTGRLVAAARAAPPCPKEQLQFRHYLQGYR